VWALLCLCGCVFLCNFVWQLTNLSLVNNVLNASVVEVQLIWLISQPKITSHSYRKSKQKKKSQNLSHTHTWELNTWRSHTHTRTYAHPTAHVFVVAAAITGTFNYFFAATIMQLFHFVNCYSAPVVFLPFSPFKCNNKRAATTTTNARSFAVYRTVSCSCGDMLIHLQNGLDYWNWFILLQILDFS